MNYQLRALQTSLFFHAFVFLLFIVMSDRFISVKESVVIDLTLEDSIVLKGYQNKPALRNRAREIKANKPAVMDRKPETVVRKDAALQALVQTAQKISAVDAQSPVLMDNEINARQEGKAEEHITLTPGSGADRISLLSEDRSIKSMTGGGSENIRDAGRARYLRANFSYIKDMINKKLTYPKTARQMGWEGQVKISFTVLSNGDAENIRIIQSSGKALLDKNAVEAVKSASPFPRPPVAAEIIIPILYKLN